MAAPMKKRKISSPSVKEKDNFPVKYPEILMFIVDRKIQRFRLDHIKQLARRKGFPVTDKLDESVTHIISELETRDQVLDVLEARLPSETTSFLQDAEIVSMGWFSSCMEEGAPVEVTQAHRLKTAVKAAPTLSQQLQVKSQYQDARYCCQRVTPLNHYNKKLTDALEVLEKQAEFLGGDQNASRSLAFRKASAALKAFPRLVRSMREVENLCDLKGGKHCKRVVQEILEEGFSSEVEDILHGEWFQTMKIFTGVFGCGAATGRKWFDLKLRSLDDVRNCSEISLTTDQKYGLEYYDDINTPVSRQEAEAIQRLVQSEVEQILLGTTVTLTGGFSRGKDTGHDVDLLISHPMEGKEEGLLALLLNVLQKKQFLEYTDVQNSSYTDSAARQVRSKQKMDHFERCFSIFCLPKQWKESCSHTCITTSNSTTTKTEDAPKKQTLDQSRTGSHSTQSSAGLNKNENETDRITSVLDLRKKTVVSHSEANDTVPDENLDTGSRHAYAKKSTNQEASPTDVIERDWVARRVDFIIAPQSQYAFALMGWIGSKMFNRSARDYANREMNMTLTSHGLFDKAKNMFLPAKTQQEIFQHLKLEYREPHERNC